MSKPLSDEQLLVLFRQKLHEESQRWMEENMLTAEPAGNHFAALRKLAADNAPQIETCNRTLGTCNRQKSMVPCQKNQEFCLAYAPDGIP